MSILLGVLGLIAITDIFFRILPFESPVETTEKSN